MVNILGENNDALASGDIEQSVKQSLLLTQIVAFVIFENVFISVKIILQALISDKSASATLEVERHEHLYQTLIFSKTANIKKKG